MSLTISQKDTIVGISFLVIILFIVCCGFSNLSGFTSGTINGYRSAYILQKENKLDDFMKVNHPDLWIKYNIDAKEQKRDKDE